MKRILITGGTGLLGSAIKNIYNNIRSEQSTESIYLFLSKKDSDLTDKIQVKQLFEKFSPTHVIHLAAHVGGLFDNMKYNHNYFTENVLINLNVLDESNNCSNVQKILSCMSTCIFPDNTEIPLKVSNLHNGLPHSSNIGYSYSKRMIDVQNRILFSTDKPYIGIIPTNLFGKHDNFNLQSAHVIPAIIHKCYLAKKNDTNLIIEGSGNAKRQFLYSDDAAKLIILILDNYNSIEPLILSPAEEYSIMSIVDKIVKIFNFTGNIIYKNDNEKNDGQLLKTADTTILHNLFPDFKFTSLDEALELTIDWFEKNYETCRK